MTLKQLSAIKLSDFPFVHPSAHVLTLLCAAFIIFCDVFLMVEESGTENATLGGFAYIGIATAAVMILLEIKSRCLSRVLAGIVFLMCALGLGIYNTMDQQLPASTELERMQLYEAIRYCLAAAFFVASIVCLASASDLFERRRQKTPPMNG